ncbi:TPA: restriction endonuclease subunit S [Neisseria gonorrhoeae]
MDMQSKAKKLIEMIQTAPVEWKPLGEVLVRTKGTKITAGQMKEMHKDNAPLKIFAGGKTFALVDFDDVPDKDIHREPSIIVKSRGIIEFEYYDKPFSHKNEMWSYHSVNKHIYIKYVYYFLKTQENYFRNIGSKMQMPQIATPDTDNYKIPIPSLETQQKIVKILDKFTELEATLEATLEAELALRKRQYRYYRDLLLDFDNQIWGGDS